MKTRLKRPIQRLLSMLLLLSALFSLLPATALAADMGTYQKTDIAEEFTSGKYVIVVSSGYAVGTLDNGWVTATDVSSSIAENTIMNPDGALVCEITVAGENATIRLSDGTYIAPKGGNNNGIQAGEYSWKWTWKDGSVTFAGTGEDTVILASNKGSDNKFRAYKTTTVDGNPNGYPSGFTLYKFVETGSEGTTVAAPQPDLQSGEVANGSEVTLSCATSGATIYYTLDGSDPTSASTAYADNQKPVISGEPGAAITLKAIAILNGVSSAVQTITYTIQTDTPEPSAPIADGNQVVIYVPAYGKALSAEYSSFYNQGTDVTEQIDGTLTGYTQADIWTVVDNKDGTFSFSYNGQKIGMGDDYTSMPLGEKYDKWKLIDNGDGTYYVQNTVRNCYMQWYESKGNWSAYHAIADGSEGLFQIKFYQVTDEPNPDPGSSGLTEGTYVMYAPELNLAISETVKSSYYPVGVSVRVDGDVMTGYGATEVWNVTGNATDGYTLTSNSGKNLSMNDSYLSTYPGAGEHDKWLLEHAEDGQYYVKNAGRSSYLFWDNSYDDWTTKLDEKTALVFFPVEAVEPEPEPDAGLTVTASPVSGASLQAGDSVTLSAGDGTNIYYTLDGSDPTKESSLYEGPIEITEELAPIGEKDLVVKAIAVLPAGGGIEEIVGEIFTFTYGEPVALGELTPYFGQLHSHTSISDGAGTVEEAFEHASNVENLDFLAVTDHSNSFDHESDSRVDLGFDCSTISSEWQEGHDAADAVTNDEFVGIYGFEMTWSDGFGHINTFNTPGFESRSNSEFGNKSGSTTGYQNYYDKLVEVESSLSQFNHPGTTFGDFQDFAFYSPEVDERITLIEVGNGEGAVGQSGYFPSYSYYTRALDKGWHVAPTNNQDNHKGNWGDSNTARSVVLADELTRENIYEAIADYRVYATEDNDLSILYSLNGNVMGSILPAQEDGIHIEVQISDPTDHADATVEVIVNGGLTADKKTLSGCNGTVTFDFDTNDYSYYYLRITQADKQIAVTAPVWTGEGVNAGISETACDTELVVKGEEITISSELFNNTKEDMQVQSLVYTVNEETIHTADLEEIAEIASGTSETYQFTYTPESAGNMTINVAMTAIVDGTEQTFTSVLRLSVTDPSLVTRILVDGTHYNDYVTGYYSDRMGNFSELAAQQNAQVTIRQPGEEITAEDLEDVSLLVISAPNKRSSSNNASGAKPTVFSSEFIQMVADYAKNGGTVILCGLADYQDSNDGAPYCSTEQINPILEAMGATMRLNDDEVLDDDVDYNGGESQTYRVYMDDFNTKSGDSFITSLFDGMQEGQRYSAYSGASIDLGESGVALVRGSENCYSINSKVRPEEAKGTWDSGKPQGSTASGSYDEDTAVVPKGDVVTLATEQVGEGRVYLAGTVFLSNFEIADSTSVDYGDASYANKVILENILDSVKKPVTVSSIAEVREAYTGTESVGQVFTVEGTVTAGNVEPNAFYDTIYIQDKTGGLNIYPVSSDDGEFRLGDRVQVTGSLDAYQGDIELRTISISHLGSGSAVQPRALTLEQAGDYSQYGGLLAQVSGTVVETGETAGVLDYAVISDGTNSFRVFFNSYIGYSDESSEQLGNFVQKNNKISAAGIVYMDPNGVCLRVRDRSEVVLVEDSDPTVPTGITLKPEKLSLSVGDTKTLTAIMEPENAAEQTVTWSSNDDKVATVEDGTVRAVGYGTAIITATVGNLSASCSVSVSCDYAESCPSWDYTDVPHTYTWYHACG